MFVAIVSFAPIKEGRDAEFRAWFAAANRAFATLPGFIGRRLLKPVEDGPYGAIIEFETQEAFKAMHGSAIHAQAAEQVKALIDGKSSVTFYETIA